MDNTNPAIVNLKVVGVGGAGCNAVENMQAHGIAGVDFLAINTDLQALRSVKKVPTFAIGPKVTRGLGCGGRPELGRKAIRESADQIAELLANQDIVFLAAGLGGGTGTGAVAHVAEIAQRQGALTVGVISLPFSFEGPRRHNIAVEGFKKLENKVDTLIAVENDKLLSATNSEISVEKAFELADTTLRQGVNGISDLITVPGLINVDFADVRTIMSNKGSAFMATGSGSGNSAAVDAANSALSNPLFNAPLKGASGILLNVKGGKDLRLNQVFEAMDLVHKATRSETDFILGVVQDRKLKKRVEVTLIATGLDLSKPQPEAIMPILDSDTGTGSNLFANGVPTPCQSNGLHSSAANELSKVL